MLGRPAIERLSPSWVPSRQSVFAALAVLASALLTFGAAPADAERKVIAPPGSDLGLPFSAAIASDELLYISGALGNLPGTKKVPGGTAEQMRQTLANLSVVLEAAGMDWSHVVDTRFYFSDSRYAGEALDIYRETVGQRPALTAVEADIAILDSRLEVSMIAARPGVAVHPIQPEGWASEGRFSSGMMAGNTLFISGMVANDPATGEWIGGDISGQTRRAMANTGHVLEAAGLGFGDLSRCRVFLADPRDYGAMNEAYGAFLTQEPPARATLRARLLHPEAKIEVQCTAVRSSDRKIIMAKGAKPSGRPFSPAVASDGTLYLAGMVGRVEGAYPASVAAQTEATLDSLAATLAAAGLGFDDVVNATVYLTDVRDYDAMNEVYAERVGKPAPARATVGTPLMSPRALVEIQMTAQLGEVAEAPQE